MEEKRFITVPLTIEAKINFDLGEEIEDQILTWQLTENEFNSLYNSGVFTLLNNECELMIDDFESESIEGNNIQVALSRLQNWENKNCCKEIEKLINMVTTALEKNTCINFDF